MCLSILPTQTQRGRAAAPGLPLSPAAFQGALPEQKELPFFGLAVVNV